MTFSPLKIVRLDGIHLPSPTFSVPHEYTEYPLTTPDETASRLKDAHVAITTTVRITPEVIASCPNLQHIAVMAIGTDCVDIEACKSRGIVVTNVPAASNESVAEHAISFYFAARRRTVRFNELLVGGTAWKEKGSLKGIFGAEFPATAREEVLGVIGVGELGTRVVNIGKALGMKVLLLDRKGAEIPVRPGRTDFATGLRECTVFIITCPMTPSTRNLISSPELAHMRKDAIVINVARGGIVDEEALVQALKDEKIAGAASDVFVKEPASLEDSALVRAANEEWAKGKLTLSPHIAWCARSSIEKLRGTVTLNVESWAKGQPRNLVE